MEGEGLRVFGRYAVSSEIAAGGMATIHLGRLLGPAGFGRVVAIKRLHPHLAKDPELVNALLDEARMAARIRHPNVVQTLDVVNETGNVLLVMDYVPGESLARLIARAARSGQKPPPAIVSGILAGALRGLHAAHEARSEHGEPLSLVHRDVSPQNILVGADGVARVLDFGIAKATNRLQTTRDGSLKGKFAYMSPEQLQGEKLDRRADVFAAGIVLWESLSAARLFKGEDPGAIMFSMLHKPTPPLPAGVASAGLDAVIARALARERDQRFATALELATALEREIPPARSREIAEWVQREASEVLAERERAVARIERESAAPVPLPHGGDAPVVEAPRAGDGAYAASEPTSVTSPSQIVTSTSHPAPTSPSAQASTPRAREAAPWKRALVLALGAVALVGLAAGIFALRSKRAAIEPTTTTSAPHGASPADGAPTLTPPPAASAEGSSSPAPADASASAAAAVASAPSSKVASKPAAVAKSAPRPPSSRATAKPPACDNPYVFDSSGIRHIKPECVRP